MSSRDHGRGVKCVTWSDLFLARTPPCDDRANLELEQQINLVANSLKGKLRVSSGLNNCGSDDRGKSQDMRDVPHTIIFFATSPRVLNHDMILTNSWLSRLRTLNDLKEHELPRDLSLSLSARP